MVATKIKTCLQSTPINSNPQRKLFEQKTKDLQNMPLENRVFFHTLILENEAQINKNNYKTILCMSKQVSLPKITSSSILQKMKIGPKSNIGPFCTKAFNLSTSEAFKKHTCSCNEYMQYFSLIWGIYFIIHC